MTNLIPNRYYRVSKSIYPILKVICVEMNLGGSWTTVRCAHPMKSNADYMLYLEWHEWQLLTTEEAVAYILEN